MPSGQQAPQAHQAHQARFHARWGHLQDPHVRTLAWLLDAPNLLDAGAPAWSGRVATLPPPDDATDAWLRALDRAPEALHAALDLHPLTRLGRYAENLMAWYLQAQGRLVAHNLQVRASKGETVGEFDFLVRAADGALLHWEFATKLYLLEENGAGHEADYFVGPNLADTLGRKIRKIMEQQLSLAQHPAAQAVLPEPVAGAQALVKGWLFYHGSTPQAFTPTGVTAAHCRGFWCTRTELDAHPAPRYAILPRLSWLAPARIAPNEAVTADVLAQQIDARMAVDAAPLLVALLAPGDGCFVECDRSFVVPDDWRERARRRNEAVR